MYRGRVLLDIDSTVADLLGPWLRDYNQAHGDDLTVDRCRAWNLHHFARAGLAIYETLRHPGLFASLEPLPGALEGVQRLLDHDLEVLAVTHCDTPAAYSDKARWIQRHLPGIHGFAIMEAKIPKHVIPCDVVIDDSPWTAEQFKGAQPHCYVATVQYPYNEGCSWFDHVAPRWDDTERAWKSITDKVLEHLGVK